MATSEPSCLQLGTSNHAHFSGCGKLGKGIRLRALKLVSHVPDSLAVRRESGQTVYYVSCKLAKKSLAC